LHCVTFAGIQLADELGFKESLSSLEQSNKRRSVNGFLAPGSFEPLAVPHNNDNQAVSVIICSCIYMCNGLTIVDVVRTVATANLSFAFPPEPRLDFFIFLSFAKMDSVGLPFIPISSGHYWFSLHSPDIFQLPDGT
jgi:hypothetical protein